MKSVIQDKTLITCGNPQFILRCLNLQFDTLNNALIVNKN